MMRSFYPSFQNPYLCHIPYLFAFHYKSPKVTLTLKLFMSVIITLELCDIAVEYFTNIVKNYSILRPAERRMAVIKLASFGDCRPAKIRLEK